MADGGRPATDRRILKTRVALARVVIELAGEKSFADVTIGEIASRAGIGYATFFRHYPDKEALLADVADSLIEELTAIIMPALLADDTAEASVAICRFIDARRPICRALLAGDAEENIRRHVVERAVRQSETLDMPHPPGLPMGLVVRHATTATLGVLAWWLDHGGDLDPQAMGAILDRLVMRPVRGG